MFTKAVSIEDGPVVDRPSDRPWESDALFQKSPGPGTYGYLAGRKMHTCSPDRLVQRCSVIHTPDVSLVWTPESPRLVPMTEVPFLWPAIKARLGFATRMAALNMVSCAALVTFDAAWRGGAERTWPFWIVLFGLPSLQSLVGARTMRRTFRRLLHETSPWPRDAPARFAFWLSSQSSWATKLLASAIAIVALCQMFRGLDASVMAAGLVKQAVWRGEAWRLLTGPILHAAPWHLVGNVAALLALGRMVEVLSHWSRFVVVFFVSVLGGSVFSVIFLPQATSVGASGGLMGLIAFLLVLGRRFAAELPPRFVASLAKGVVWVAVTGLVAYAVIDNAAHLGGFLAGGGMAFRLVPRDGALPLRGSPSLKRAGLGALASLLLSAVGAATVLLLHD